MPSPGAAGGTPTHCSTGVRSEAGRNPRNSPVSAAWTTTPMTTATHGQGQEPQGRQPPGRADAHRVRARHRRGPSRTARPGPFPTSISPRARNRTTRATAGPRGSTATGSPVLRRPAAAAGRYWTSDTSPTTWMSASGAAALKSAAGQPSEVALGPAGRGHDRDVDREQRVVLAGHTHPVDPRAVGGRQADQPGLVLADHGDRLPGRPVLERHRRRQADEVGRDVLLERLAGRRPSAGCRRPRRTGAVPGRTAGTRGSAASRSSRRSGCW